MIAYTDPVKAIKKPGLIGFCDGSSQAFTATVYSVTIFSKIKYTDQEQLLDGDIDDSDYDPNLHKFQVHLIASKARFIPLKTGLKIPKSDLLGVLLCTRLINRKVRLYSGGCVTISCVRDSTCIIWRFGKDSLQNLYGVLKLHPPQLHEVTFVNYEGGPSMSRECQSPQASIRYDRTSWSICCHIKTLQWRSPSISMFCLVLSQQR